MLKKRSFLYWDFVEKNYPNYYNSDEILFSDVLLRFLTDEEISIEDKKIVEEIGEKSDIKEFFINLEVQIFKKALENFLA